MHLEWRGPRPPGRSEAASGPSRPCCTTRASRRSWSGRSPCSAPRTPARPRSVARASPSLPLGPARCRDQSFSRVSGQVSILMKATVLMRQPGRVQEIVGALRRGGGDRLQVISDFDMTLSRFAYNGKRCPSSHNILDNSKIISEECRKELKALLHHYYPIEIDPHWTIKEKLPHMVEWWTKAHSLLCEQKIQKFQIAQVVRESNAMLREGYKTFFNTLYQNSVPLFIFSAGIGDILEEIIRQKQVFHPNIHVVSNYMDFDEDGFLQGFKGQLIHTYNKNSTVCENSGYFQQLQGKTNILLLGDSMGDLTMADGVLGVENILKIGFLNDKVEEQRERYMESYDIVLEKDESLDVVNGLLQHILHQGDWVEMRVP
ncbi:7-methylguanosine phosphate-specific 5'-nucleotidase isoform X1 [Rousettus aegyptiacus]|uniref:5'-nucleotidase n=1 Tax=Rousettus aegyptiacus TaxID=9407 RepID=A0A7J8GE62_ROUAE|nr:7-methylguanosine phosphate-specific 5'-nucleotidase isoform X1 [Rousettus aegyptiacus]KAF6457909.1 5'-nucleotidase, cytosolic IIIB [Rousettus aegyptiacus]